jgi:hypothetical protein
LSYLRGFIKIANSAIEFLKPDVLKFILLIKLAEVTEKIKIACVSMSEPDNFILK